MEIVKHGNMYRIIICPKCECEFRFGIKEICLFETPDSFPKLGFQVGMIHISKGYNGDIKLSEIE